jgi:membrane-associated phospholipid phosphatase
VDEEHPRSGQPLLDGPARRWAGTVLACCVTLVAVLGGLFARQAQPAWIDRVVDDPVIAWLGAHGQLLSWLAYPATLLPAGGISAVVAIGCLVARRFNGAILAAAAIPVASTINDALLKPLVHRTYQGQLTYPSGHTASMFALAAMITVLLLMPWQRVMPAVPRLVIMVGAWALGCVVAIAVIGLRWHYFTDTVGGAAVGTGTVCGLALILDLPVISRWRTWGRSRDQV